jgi:CHAT domain-containing protein/tetratricopeptide (TPR) repeat protein
MDDRSEMFDLADQVLKAVAEFASSKHAPSDIERLLRPELLDGARSLARSIQSGAVAHPQRVPLNEILALGWFYWYRFLVRPEGPNQEDLRQSLSWFSSVFPMAPESIPQRVCAHLQESLITTGSSPAGEATVMAIERYQAYARTGETTHLDSAIDLFREAVAAVPAGHPDRAGRLSDLGAALQVRLGQGGTVGDLGEAVDVAREAVAAVPAGHPDRGDMLSNLGAALQVRLGRGGEVGDLDEAVDVAREAVAVVPAGHPERARHLIGLETALERRFERGGEVGDLDEAVSVGREAVAAAPAGHAERAGSLSSLGSALQRRFERGGAVGDVNEAIDIAREAVAATPAGRSDRIGALANLGVALLTRFDRGGAISDADEGIKIEREVVTATPAGHPDHARYLSNLSLALWRRFKRGGAVDALDEAIVVGREAVADAPAGHPDRPVMLSSLCIALQGRFERDGAVGDLDEAIEIAREAVTATPAGHPNRAMHLTNLGAALQRRLGRGGAVGDLDEAVDVAREAVAAAPAGHPERAVSLSNLGIALQNRFERGGSVGDLDEAIKIAREAVTATLASHPERGGRLSNLGIALQIRFARGGVVGDLNEAIVVGREAVTATLIDHPNRAGSLSNLGIALQIRFEQGGAISDLDEAKQCFRAAIDIESATPSLRVRAYHRLGGVQRLAGELPEEVAASLRRAVSLHSEEVAPRALDWQDQEHLLGEHSGLVTDAIAVHLDANDLRGALEVAELGRAVLLSYATEDRSDLTALRELDSELADSFETALGDLNSSPPSPQADGYSAVSDRSSELMRLNAWTQRRQRAGTQRSDLLSHIRSLPGMDSFLGTTPAQDLLDGLPAEGHVVLVNVSGLRCDALLCSRGAQPVAVTLASLTASYVRNKVTDLLSAMQDPRPLAGQKRRQRVIGEVLAWLWDTTVAPVLDHLSGTDRAPRIWWVPTGLMAALPLHAAAPRSGPGALERTVSSYAPSIRSLTGSHQNRTSGLGRMLVASLPQTPAIRATSHRPARPAAQDLPGTTAEAKALRSPGLLPPRLIVDDLSGARASLGAVTDSLRQATWAHLACHADADPAQPSNGRLLLYDGDLTIPELARLRLDHAQLAYLSACSTAVGGLRQADEVITVATAFRIAGFRHVIGTLWPLSDDIAPVAAKLFYETLSHLLRTEPELDDNCYAHALHQTVTKLRNQGFKPHQWAQLVHIGP